MHVHTNERTVVFTFPLFSEVSAERARRTFLHLLAASRGAVTVDYVLGQQLLRARRNSVGKEVAAPERKAQVHASRRSTGFPIARRQSCLKNYTQLPRKRREQPPR